MNDTMYATDRQEIETLKEILTEVIRANQRILEELKADVAKIKAEYMNVISCGHCKLCWRCRELGNNVMTEDQEDTQELCEVSLED